MEGLFRPLEPDVGTPENALQSLWSHRPDAGAGPVGLRESDVVVAFLAVGGGGLCRDVSQSGRRSRSLTVLGFAP